MIPLDVTIQYFRGCPHWRLAESRVKAAVEGAGVSVRISHERIDSPEEAETKRFRGSPTILIDGVDAFADSQTRIGLSCRTYRTESGAEGSPSVSQIQRALIG